jgi:hypothetical protein
MKTQTDADADTILREWAKDEGHSLRRSGIIDERRERTVREREVTFADFFASRRRARHTD